MNSLSLPRFYEAPLFADEAGDVEISFEFFPPKTEKMEITLWDTVQSLAPLGPRFVSVTYGAGGSTRERTHATVARIARENKISAAAHLTCIDADKAKILDITRAYWDAGVRRIVALRGDSLQAGQKYAPHPNGFANAAALTAGLTVNPWHLLKYRSQLILSVIRIPRAWKPIWTI
jgi:methylenetetrahydrofolate reductase (NADPH)